MGLFDNLNRLQIGGGALKAGAGLAGFFDARTRKQERERANLQPLPIEQRGDIRPDEPTIQRALESIQSGQRSDTPNPLAQRLLAAETQYREGQASGQPGGFDPDVYEELVQHAISTGDKGLFEVLTGGVGQDVLRGYDPETGQAHGVDPTSLHPEALAANREAGGLAPVTGFETSDDIRRLIADDFQRAGANYQREVGQADKFGEDVEALLGQEGSRRTEIDRFQTAGYEAASGIETRTQAGIDVSRRENELSRERLRGDVRESLAGAESRRTRGLSEFTDDTAQRIESERTGLNARLGSDINQMMREMQASGASQRKIHAAVREQSFAHRTELSSLSMKHNIEVAKERSALGLSYDTLTNTLAQTGLGEVGALERAGVAAESGFATLTMQAAEAAGRYRVNIEENVVTLRGQADEAYLNGQITLGNMYKGLSDSMPQATEWAAFGWEVGFKEDLIDRGFTMDQIAFLSGIGEDVTGLGNQAASVEAAEEAQAAAEGSNSFLGPLGTGVGMAAGAVLAAPTGGMSIAAGGTLGGGIGKAFGGSAAALTG